MKKLTTYILVFLITFSLTNVLGQTDTTKQKISFEKSRPHFVVSGGLSYQKQLVGEAGLIYGYTFFPNEGPGIQLAFCGLKLATEFNFNSKSFFIAPKFGAEFNFLFLGARLNIIDYTNFIYHDLKLTPEIGLSLLGFVNVFYGYNISITDNRVENIGTHRITLTINYDKIVFGK